MGWDAKNYKGAALEFILDGLLEFNYDLSKEPRFGDPGVRKDPTWNDKMHTVCIFVPASEVSQATYIRKLNKFINRVRSRDLQVLLVLSKIDDYEPALSDPANYPRLYETEIVQGLLEEVSKATALPLMNIVPLINYHKVLAMNEHLSFFAFYLLQRALDLAEDFIDVRADELKG